MDANEEVARVKPWQDGPYCSGPDSEGGNGCRGRSPCLPIERTCAPASEGGGRIKPTARAVGILVQEIISSPFGFAQGRLCEAQPRNLAEVGHCVMLRRRGEVAEIPLDRRRLAE